MSILDERILSESAIFFATLHRITVHEHEAEEAAYQIGSMANAINFVSFTHIRRALLTDRFNNSGNVATKYPSNTADVFGGRVVNISGVYGYRDSFDFDIIRSHGLLFNVCESGCAAFLDDDCLHCVCVVMRKEYNN